MDICTTTILAAYAVCVKTFAELGEHPSGEQLSGLKDAHTTFRTTVAELLERLNQDGLTWEDSWVLSKWMYQDYSHETGQYICPADMMSEIETCI